MLHDRLLKMRQYRSKYVLARDFMALFAAFLWAGRYYTSTNLEKICNPDWHNFSSYVVSTIAALIVIELFCWMVWHIQGLILARQESLKPGDTPTLTVAVKHPTAKLFLSKFIPGVFLIGISTVVGAPTPCQPLVENASALQFVVAGLLLGGGFLLVGNTFIREVRPGGTD
jgi:hypothetical protein